MYLTPFSILTKNFSGFRKDFYKKKANQSQQSKMMDDKKISNGNKKGHMFCF